MIDYKDLDLTTIKPVTVRKYDNQSKSVITYYNFECGFDIETSSTFIEDDKVAFMYMWTFGICDKIVYGRTWEQFLELCKTLQEHFNLSETNIPF